MSAKRLGSIVTLTSTISVPQDAKEAGKLLASLGELQRETQRISDESDKAITKIQEMANTELAPLYENMRAIFTALKAFADVRRKELTQGGKKKTVNLGTGFIFWRNTPPKVSIKDEAAVLAMVQQMGLDDFLRTQPQLDKEAMRKNPDAASVVPGVQITREEVFYAKPTDGTGELNQGKLDSLMKSTP